MWGWWDVELELQVKSDRTKKNDNSEYKDNSTEHIEIWTLGYLMGMRRILIHIIGAVCTSL